MNATPVRSHAAAFTSLRNQVLIFILTLAFSTGLARAQAPMNVSQPSTGAKAAPASHDLTKPTLYLVGYAHLDTQWRWEYPQVINEYLSKTMRANFDLRKSGSIACVTAITPKTFVS